MSSELISHIRRFVFLDDDSAAKISSAFDPAILKKKAILLSEGQLCKKEYFVIKGCLRMFFVDDKGLEQTSQFAIENWWIADYKSYENRLPAMFFIQAVEPTQVLSIEHDIREKLFGEIPAFSQYYRNVLQKAYAATQVRFKLMKEYSREEMYHHFVLAFPDFVNRVPQYMLASYLGFTPEYLSEIRKRIKEKGFLKPV